MSSTQQLIIEDAVDGAVLAQTNAAEIGQRENASALAMAWDFAKSYTAAVAGNEAAAQLAFRDDTIPYSSVNTEYNISIARRNSAGDRIYIGEKLFLTQH